MAAFLTCEDSEVIHLRIRKTHVATLLGLPLVGALVTVLVWQAGNRPADVGEWMAVKSDLTATSFTEVSGANHSVPDSPPLSPPPRGSDTWRKRIVGELACNKGATVQNSEGEERLDSPPGFTITKDNLEHIVACICNAEKQLIFTTFDIWRGEDGTLQDSKASGITAFNYNFVTHIRQTGVENVLLIGMSDDACVASRELGLPCYVNTFPYMKGKNIYKGLQVALKWYYMLQIASLGYHPIFLDNDVAVMKNPFLDWDMTYDFQALSDIISKSGTLPPLVRDFPCGVAYDNLPPCISSGVMFLRSSHASVKFLEAMVEQVEIDGEEGWEQATLQGLVQSFLVQVGNNPSPLSLRVLPLENYHNLNMLEFRQAHKKSCRTIIAHCGYIGAGAEKKKKLESFGFWIPTPDLNREGLQGTKNKNST